MYDTEMRAWYIEGKWHRPVIIPKDGILKYRMDLFQMSNEEVERELRLPLFHAWHEAAKHELNVRRTEEYYEAVSQCNETTPECSDNDRSSVESCPSER